MGGTRRIPKVDGNLHYDFSSIPTLRELRTLRKLLADFGINEKIPEFATRQEMYNWKRRVISQRLK